MFRLNKLCYSYVTKRLCFKKKVFVGKLLHENEFDLHKKNKPVGRERFYVNSFA